jgi:hypothetical protein
MKKHVVLALTPILVQALFVLSAGSARAVPRNLVMAACTSCTTVTAFQDYAQSDIPSGAYYINSAGTPHVEAFFNIYNPNSHEAAFIGLGGACLSTADGTPCSWNYEWTDPGSIPEMQQDYEEIFPPLGVEIPSSVASTFTGATQAPTIESWLANETQSDPPPVETVILAVFPDGSDAEYIVVGSSPLSYGFVSGRGHASDGVPIDDSGDTVAVPTFDSLGASSFDFSPPPVSSSYIKPLLILDEPHPIGVVACSNSCEQGAADSLQNTLNAIIESIRVGIWLCNTDPEAALSCNGG